MCSLFIVNFSFCHHLIDIHLYKFFTCLGVNKICLNHETKITQGTYYCVPGTELVIIIVIDYMTGGLDMSVMYGRGHAYNY